MIGYIIAAGISAVILIKFGSDILKAQKSRSWPTASGTVLDSGMEAHQSRDEDGDIKTTYGATIQYKYLVDGQEFQGNRRTFSNVRTSSVRNTEKILERYPLGSSVDVFYDPDDPSSSVLEPGVGAGTYILLAVPIGIFVFGIAGILGIIG
jgi:hypothetical protein